ncbi:hypothetical protein H8E07_21310 [bacterium]|nr:hypothetical protein [bacterium]
MKIGWKTMDRLLALAAAAMGIASIALNDADKSPLYGLLAYALARLSLTKLMPEA